MHFPGLSHLGSGTRVFFKGADSVGPTFCVLPRSEQLRLPGVWRAWSLQLMASPVPVTWFSGCTTGVHSQADVNRPESQEVFANKGPFSQGYGFSSSHVWMGELDHKES